MTDYRAKSKSTWFHRNLIERIHKVAIRALVFALMSMAGSVFAQEKSDAVENEYLVKAAFVFNLSKYVDWPQAAFEGPDSKFVFGVLGDPPPNLRQGLLYYQRKKLVGQRAIEVRFLKTAEEVAGCHLLFIRRTLDEEVVRNVITACGNKPVLLVGESDDFQKIGGGVNFVESASRIKLHLELSSTKRRNLKLDSRLINVARVVEEFQASTNAVDVPGNP
jgi:hypothetical protein